MNLAIRQELTKSLRYIAKRKDRNFRELMAELVVEFIEPIVFSMEKELKRKKVGVPSKAVRVEILKRDKGICVYCGGIGNYVDHVIPRMEVGTSNKPENLVATCNSCNLKAGSRLFNNFNEKKKYILEQILIYKAYEERWKKFAKEK